MRGSTLASHSAPPLGNRLSLSLNHLLLSLLISPPFPLGKLILACGCMITCPLSLFAIHSSCDQSSGRKRFAATSSGQAVGHLCCKRLTAAHTNPPLAQMEFSVDLAAPDDSTGWTASRLRRHFASVATRPPSAAPGFATPSAHPAHPSATPTSEETRVSFSKPLDRGSSRPSGDSRSLSSGQHPPPESLALRRAESGFSDAVASLDMLALKRGASGLDSSALRRAGSGLRTPSVSGLSDDGWVSPGDELALEVLAELAELDREDAELRDSMRTLKMQEHLLDDSMAQLSMQLPVKRRVDGPSEQLDASEEMYVPFN